MPQELIDRWSSRHHQVRKAIHARLEDRRARWRAMIAGRGPDANEARRELAELETSAQLAPKQDRYLTTATRARKQAVQHARGSRRALAQDRHASIGSTPRASGGYAPGRGALDAAAMRELLGG